MTLTPRIDVIDKNYIINGDARYWQRDDGSTTPVPLPSTHTYNSIDRFKIASTATTPTIKRDTVVPLTQPFAYSMLFSGTFTLATQTHSLIQYIESINSIELINKNVSLGFWYKTDNHAQATVTFRTPTLIDDYTSYTDIASVSVSLVPDNTWRFAKVEGVNVGTGVRNGLGVVIDFGQNTVLNAVSTLNVTGIKLNIGDKAQEFSYFGRNGIEELNYCQRYYWTTKGNNVIRTSYATATPNWVAVFEYTVPMRTVPTSSVVGVWNLIGIASISPILPSNRELYLTVDGTTTTMQQFSPTDINTAYLKADAEIN